MKIPTAKNRSYGGRERGRGRDGERSVDDLALGHGLDIVSRKSRGYVTLCINEQPGSSWCIDQVMKIARENIKI